MQSLSNKCPDRTTADSFSGFFGGRSSSLWFSTTKEKEPQLSISKSIASELSESQEQDSPSTLSSGKSHHDVNFGLQNISFQPGFVENYKKREEDSVRTSQPFGNADYMGHHVQMEHNQSMACMSYPVAGSYFGRITAAYEPNAVVYPQMMGITSSRTVLPLDCTEGIPIYVNAKQYHAILRRRQIRAKLEAQNKLERSRKPYLHESRHRHALKRARGSGGRFLNTKSIQQSKTTTQQPKTSTQTYIKNQEYEGNSWETSTTTVSDVSCIFNNDDIFQQPDSRASISSLTLGPTGQNGVQSRVIAPQDGLVSSMERCTRISTVT